MLHYFLHFFTSCIQKLLITLTQPFITLLLNKHLCILIFISNAAQVTLVILQNLKQEFIKTRRQVLYNFNITKC
jgi:hypothetical protein